MNDEELWKKRFQIFAAVRLLGVATFLLGLVIAFSDLVRPGGMLVLSTINRTLKSYALAIVAAEYVLGWLPRGTHQWDRFVTPDELTAHIEAAGLAKPQLEGFVYDPLRDRWDLSSDTGVNYLAAAAKP